MYTDVLWYFVDYCLLKPQKRFELNWFNVAITTTGRLGLRWLPTVSWKVGEMQIFAFSNRSLGTESNEDVEMNADDHDAEHEVYQEDEDVEWIDCY